jgi:hypothetical protein
MDEGRFLKNGRSKMITGWLIKETETRINEVECVLSLEIPTKDRLIASKYLSDLKKHLKDLRERL